MDYTHLYLDAVLRLSFYVLQGFMVRLDALRTSLDVDVHRMIAGQVHPEVHSITVHAEALSRT